MTTGVPSRLSAASPEELEKAQQLAKDPEVIERVQRALEEVKEGKTVALAALPKAVASKRAKLRQVQAEEASTA